MLTVDHEEYVTQLLDDGLCEQAREYLRSEEANIPPENAERLWADIRKKEQLLGRS